jgi:hypothetical protein
VAAMVTHTTIAERIAATAFIQNLMFAAIFVSVRAAIMFVHCASTPAMTDEMETPTTTLHRIHLRELPYFKGYDSGRNAIFVMAEERQGMGNSGRVFNEFQRRSFTI